MDGEPVGGCEGDRLHLAQGVLRQVGPVVEQETCFTGLPVQLVVGDGAGVVVEPDEPTVVIVGPVDDRKVTGIELGDDGQFAAQRGVDRLPLEPRPGKCYQLDLEGVGMHQHARDVVPRILGQDLFGAGSQVDGNQPGGVRMARVGDVEGSAVGREADRLAVEILVGAPGEERSPLGGIAVSDEEVEAAVFPCGHGTPDLQVHVRHPADHVAGVLGDHHQLVGVQVQQIDVVQPLVALVDAEQHAGGMVLGVLQDLGLDLLERSEIGGVARFQIHPEEVPVLVAAGVLDVEHRAVVVAPEI